MIRGLLNSKVVKYLATGGLSFVFEFSIFVALVYGLTLQVGWSQAISYALALVVNFTLLRAWAFKSNKASKASVSLVKYGLLVLVNLPLTAFLIEFIVDSGASPALAKVLVTLLAATWNYFVYNKLIFKNDAPTDGAADKR